MICRLLSAAALVGALGMPARAVAKPPDLPMNETITVKPPVASEIEGPPDPRENPPLHGGTIVTEAEPMTPPVIDVMRGHSAVEPMRAHPLFEMVLVPPPFEEVRAIFRCGGACIYALRNGQCSAGDCPAFVQMVAEEELPPATSLYEALPAALPTPTLYLLRPTARRTLAGSLLFGVNPLLALMPTDKVLDAPCDHPQQVAGDDVLNNVPIPHKVANTFPLWLTGHEAIAPLDYIEEGDWLKWLVSHWAARHCTPSPEEQDGQLQESDTGRFIAGLTPVDTPTGEIDAPLTPAVELLPMPQEDACAGMTCPWLCQQAVDRHACQFADPQVGRDVLDNLESLMAADDLLEMAEKLALFGHIREAFECCALAQDLCPGSPCADRAACALFDLYVRMCAPALATEEAAEQIDDPPGQARKCESFWGWVGQMIGWPINVYSSDPNTRIRELLSASEDLRQIETEWERIWITDNPAPSTPKKVDGEAQSAKTREEKSIEKRLNKPVSVNFHNAPLRQVLDDLRAFLNVNIYVDEPALVENRIRLDTPITVKLENIAFKSALSLILHTVRLTYVVKDDVVHVTTEEHARGKLERRVYQVADLLEHKDLPKDSGLERCKGESREDRLIKAITSTVAPRSWAEEGGPGTIDYFPRSRSLIVNQTPDVQEQIIDLLAALRRLYDKDGEEKEEVRPDIKAAQSRTASGVEQQVRGLMKACRLLINEGLHEQAAELARQAFALDPERVMADPLMYKMHLLAHTPEKQPAGSSEASEPPSCPYCPSIGKPIREIVPDKKKSESGPATLLVPPTPPVDYEVVPAPGGEEASEEDAPSGLDEWIEAILGGPGRAEFGFGINADGGLRLCGECRYFGTVYHVLYSRGCLAVWKTPDAAKAQP